MYKTIAQTNQKKIRTFPGNETKILLENQWSETITNSEIKCRFFKVGDSYKKSTTLQKMASEKRELGDIMNCHACDYNCRYDHEEAETISSSTYRWKCDKHFPVCLFGSYKDDMMHTSHFMFGVSRLSTLYIRAQFQNTFEKITIFFIPSPQG